MGSMTMRGEPVTKLYIVTEKDGREQTTEIPCEEASLEWERDVDFYYHGLFGNISRSDVMGTVKFRLAGDAITTLNTGRSKRSEYRKRLPKRVIVSGPCVICLWQDGTKTISRCHDGDEMDVKTGIILNAIKRWMPGGSYWLDVMDDVEVEYQGKLEKIRKVEDSADLKPYSEIDIEPAPAPEINVKRRPKPTDPYHRGLAYSDEEKLAALEMMEGGLSAAEVSRRTGIHQTTLSKWKREYRGRGKDNCRE